MARKTTPKAESGDTKPVVRDAGFVRLVADTVVVVDLGRDFELALVMVGNPISEITRHETDEALGFSSKTRPEVTEVGRVRMSPFAALNMSMNVIAKLIKSGQIDTELLSTSIEEMIRTAPDASDREENT